MTQMTNQKKTKLSDDLDQVWTKIHNCRKSLETIFPKTALKIVFRHKNSEKGPTFSLQFSERVDMETIKWHSPERKYRKEIQSPGKVLKFVNDMV